MDNEKMPEEIKKITSGLVMAILFYLEHEDFDYYQKSLIISSLIQELLLCESIKMINHFNQLSFEEVLNHLMSIYKEYALESFKKIKESMN